MSPPNPDEQTYDKDARNSNVSADQLSIAELALDNWGIPYTKQNDGTIVVEGDINISEKSLSDLPDLSCVIVQGNFWCNGNQLTSLKGAPAFVGQSFMCHDNQLTSLSGAPAHVGGHFLCTNNKLTTLKGAPASIDKIFFCDGNMLADLEGAPQRFYRLVSDLGEFSSWDAVPEEIKFSAETRQKQKEHEEWRRAGMPLKQPLRAAKPLRFDKKP